MIGLNTINDDNYLKNLKRLIISLELIDNRLINSTKKEKILRKLKDSYNKLYLYNMHYGKQLIAVTGLQGAGKTTLVRELFDIPEGIMPENNSRGERLPIFISEGNVTEPQTYRIHVDKESEEHKIIKEKISYEEFRTVSMEPEEDKDLWLECQVPINILKNSDKVIALLPGYEKSKRDFSQKLLDFIVHMSKFSIMVLNKNTFARKSTEGMLEKIEEKFKGLSPIIAITHGDQSPEENEVIKSSIINELKVKNPSRVVVTGSTKVFGDDWKTHIVDAMENLWAEEVSMSNDNNESLNDTFEHVAGGIENTIALLEEVERANQINEILKSAVKSPVNKFKEEYESYLIKLEKELTQTVQSIPIHDNDVKEVIDENSNFLKSLKKIFVKTDVQDAIDFNDDITKLWSDKKFGVYPKTLNISTKVMYDQVEKIEFGSTETKKISESKYTLPDSVSYNINDSEDNNENIVKINQNVPANLNFNEEQFDDSVSNINRYFLQDIKTSNHIEPTSLKQNDYDVLVFMGAQFFNHSIKSINESNLIKSSSIDDNSLDNIKLQFGNQPLNDAKSFNVLKKSLIAVPVILGLDVAIDGEADIIQNVFLAKESLATTISTLGFEVSAAAITNISLGLLGVGTAAFIANRVMKDVNNSQIELYKNANILLSKLKESQIKSYIDNQKAIFERMEDKLVRKESQLRGEDEFIGQIEEVLYLANRIHNTNREVMRTNYEKGLLF